MEAINLWARRDIFQGVECLGYDLVWSTFKNVVAARRRNLSETPTADAKSTPLCETYSHHYVRE